MTKNMNYQIYILDASAGTGKTYNLAKYYVKLLLNGIAEDIRTLLAITFTNKATIEMKQRILEMLKKVALEKLTTVEKKDFDNTVVKITPEVVSRASNIVDSILKNYHYFQVQTIDSFINTIVTVSSLQLGISPSFKIETDYKKYLKYSLDLFINASLEDNDIRNLLEKFLVNYLIIEDKKNWYPKKDILEILSILYDFSRIYGKKFDKVCSYKKTNNLINLSKKLYGLVAQFYHGLVSEPVDKKFVNAIKKFLDENKEREIINIDELSKYFTYDKVPVVKNGQISKYLHYKWENIRKTLSQLCETKAFQLYNSYIDIFNHVDNIIENVTRDENIVFLTELNKKVNEMVASGINLVPELYIRLATRIRQCLIDEFQDTSVLQWENILPIIEEILASGGTLFYVGDKKQSIYRFRGSDYRLFDAVIQKYFPQYTYNRDTLTKNCRSEKSIVEFNNKVFSVENLLKVAEQVKEVMLKDEISKIYSNSQQEVLEERTSGYVYGELVDVETDKYEDYIKQKVITILSNLSKRYEKFPETAILVRDNKEVKVVSNWLLENNFAVESEKTLDVLENEFVKEIISMLKFLLTPFDNLSFASFILGKIFSYSAGVSYQEMEKLVIQWGQNKNVYLYQFFKEKFPSLWEKYFQRMIELSYVLPVYDLLISMYSVFNFSSNPEFKLHYPFFYHLLKLAKQTEEKNCSIRYFIDKLNSLSEEEKYVVAKGENAVKVMTIHQSKGLGFDIVILPFVELNIEVGKQKGFMSKFIVKDEGDRLCIVKLNKTMVSFSTKIRQIYEEEYKKLFIDELNVLYVGFTRAKKQVYFFVPKKYKNKNNLAQYLFPWDEQNIVEVGDKELSLIKHLDSKIMNSEELNIVKTENLYPIEHRDWRSTIVEQDINKEEIINKEKIVQGEIIHKILSYLDNLENKNIDVEIDKAIQKTKIYFSSVSNKEWERFKQTIYKIVQNVKFRDIFYVKEGRVFCEYEVVNSSGETRRVDRVIVFNDKIKIIDYKLYSLSEDEIYKNQLKEYKQILSEIYRKPTYGYILYIDKMDLVEV